MNTRHLTPSELRGRRWRGLVRESTEKQQERWSPDRQKADLRTAAVELGLVDTEPLFYERTGSGEVEGAPELELALEDARRREYDVLLVLHTSRFARNRAEAVRVKREFAKTGTVIYFVSQRIISGTYTGALTEGVSEVIDEFENETRRMWIAGGIRERQLTGRWIGGIPFGYRKVLVDFPDGTRGWDGGLEPDPETARVVRKMFDRAAAGLSTGGIAFELNVAGSRAPAGGPWGISTLWNILRNPVYTGRMIRYRRHRTRHYYNETDLASGRVEVGQHAPAIIDETLFDDVQRILSGRLRDMNSETRLHYPLSRVLRCRRCGYRMNGVNNGRGGRYYRCVGRVSFHLCDAKMISAKELEGAFADWLGTLHLPSDWREEIARTDVRAARTDEQDRTARLEERLKRLQNLYAWGDIAEHDYRTQAAAIRADMGVMAKPAIASLEAVAAALATLRDSWLSSPPATQAALPGLMLRGAEVEAGAPVEWVVRAELRPLLDLCVQPLRQPRLVHQQYIVRYSA